MRAVQPLSREVLDPNGPVLVVEEDTRGQRVQVNLEAVGVAPRRLKDAFARSHPCVTACRERHVSDADRVVLHEAPVIRIEPAFE